MGSRREDKTSDMRMNVLDQKEQKKNGIPDPRNNRYSHLSLLPAALFLMFLMT